MYPRIGFDGANSTSKRMVPPGRLEHPTNGLGNRCSIHLSYGGENPERGNVTDESSPAHPETLPSTGEPPERPPIPSPHHGDRRPGRRREPTPGTPEGVDRLGRRAPARPDRPPSGASRAGRGGGRRPRGPVVAANRRAPRGRSSGRGRSARGAGRRARRGGRPARSGRRGRRFGVRSSLRRSRSVPGALPPDGYRRGGGSTTRGPAARASGGVASEAGRGVRARPRARRASSALRGRRRLVGDRRSRLDAPGDRPPTGASQRERFRRPRARPGGSSSSRSATFRSFRTGPGSRTVSSE